MRTLDSPTRFCDLIAETTDETLDYTERVGQATPFEDIENALTLLQERATTIDSTEEFKWTTHPGPASFETQESGESVEYIFDEGDLYRVVA